MQTNQPSYTFEGHNTSGVIAGKRYCTSCGLVLLNNEMTNWSFRMGCLFRDHPQFESARKRYTTPEWAK